MRRPRRVLRFGRTTGWLAVGAVVSVGVFVPGCAGGSDGPETVASFAWPEDTLPVSIEIGRSNFLLLGLTRGEEQLRVMVLSAVGDRLVVSPTSTVGSDRPMDDFSAKPAPDGSWLVVTDGCTEHVDPELEGCPEKATFLHTVTADGKVTDRGRVDDELDGGELVGLVDETTAVLSFPVIEDGAVEPTTGLPTSIVRSRRVRLVDIESGRSELVDWAPPRQGEPIERTGPSDPTTVPTRIQCVAGTTLYNLDSEPGSDPVYTLHEVPLRDPGKAKQGVIDVPIEPEHRVVRLLCEGERSPRLVVDAPERHTVSVVPLGLSRPAEKRQDHVYEGTVQAFVYGQTSVLFVAGPDDTGPREDQPTQLFWYGSGEWRVLDPHMSEGRSPMVSDDGSVLLNIGSEITEDRGVITGRQL